MVICLERGADLHMAQLMPLPLTVSFFSKIHIGFTFLVPAHLGSPGQMAVKRVYVNSFKLWQIMSCNKKGKKTANGITKNAHSTSLNMQFKLETETRRVEFNNVA